MANIDYTPLFRTAVGYENIPRLVKLAMSRDDNEASYPPYNIEKIGDNTYRITFAVAGFTKDEIDITTEQNTLTVKGKNRKDEHSEYLYQGIAGRSFERRFQLAHFMEVTEASLENGLLEIHLVRELPEKMKPRRIPIQRAGSNVKSIEHARENAA